MEVGAGAGSVNWFLLLNMGLHAKHCAVRIFETGGSDFFDMPCECGCGLSSCCQYITFEWEIPPAPPGPVRLDFDNTIPSYFLNCLTGSATTVSYIEVYLDGCPATGSGGTPDYIVGTVPFDLVPPVDLTGVEDETCVCLIFYDAVGEEMGRCSVDGTMVKATF